MYEKNFKWNKQKNLNQLLLLAFLLKLKRACTVNMDLEENYIIVQNSVLTNLCQENM